MSETINFKEVIDDWYDLGLGKKYVHEEKRVALSLSDIFANHSLKIVQDVPDKLRKRYTDIVKKNKDNQSKKSRPRYFGFKDLEKHFYSVVEFPDLCAKDGKKG